MDVKSLFLKNYFYFDGILRNAHKPKIKLSIAFNTVLMTSLLMESNISNIKIKAATY